MRVVVVGVLLVTLTGCKLPHPMQVYPLEGPLAAQRPVPVIEAVMTGALDGWGDMTVTLPGGEQCVGRWLVQGGRADLQYLGTGSGSVTRGLDTATYQTNRTGRITGNLGGMEQGMTVLRCARGGIMEVQIARPSGSLSGSGTARDSYGNVYRIIF